MDCLKCGRTIDPGSVFCDNCLEGMEKYPVKSDTPINLPRRTLSAAKKAPPRRRALSHEELVAVQRKTIKRLWLALLCTLVCLALSVVLMLYFAQNQETHTNIGQNYSTREAPDNS